MTSIATPAVEPRRPGQLLKEEFIDRDPTLTQGRVALGMGVSRPHLNDLLNKREKRVTAEMALRLARFFGTRAESWLYAQADWDLHTARSDRRLTAQVERIIPWYRENGPIFRHPAESAAAAASELVSPLKREEIAQRVRDRVGARRAPERRKIDPSTIRFPRSA
jgi:addiction module HigA family antidote